MKKLIFFLAAVLLTAFSARTFAQDQTTFVNGKHNYSVNTAVPHTGSDYTWAVYTYSGTTWAASDLQTIVSYGSPEATLDTDYKFITDGTLKDNQDTIQWLKAGQYIVAITEKFSPSGCTTTRFFGVDVLDLDLLVLTEYDGFITSDTTLCNTSSDTIIGSDSDETVDKKDVNNYTLATMTFTYKISLHTLMGSKYDENLISSKTSVENAKWQFVIDTTDCELPIASTTTDNTYTPSITLNYTSSDGTFTPATGLVTDIPAKTGEVVITATIQNIATEETADYVLNLKIDPSSVKIENSTTPNGDYAEGQELNSYDGSNNGFVEDTNNADTNETKQITVHSIPNTSKITFQ